MARTPYVRPSDAGTMSNRRPRWLAWVFAVIVGVGMSADQAAGREVPFAEPPAISTTADGARSVVTADLDGDGDLDVLSASSGDDTIAWYENDGAGGGWTHRTITTSADSARAVFAADVDGDGHVDVLSASFSDNTIAWYENDGTPGDGGWTAHTISTQAFGAASVFAADVDGDGHVDVLSASFNDSTIAWYENDGTPGDGGWTPHDVSTSASFATSVFAADVDGDGHVDVLSASAFDNTIAWYENDGSGGGWTAHTISTEAFDAASVFAADIDGDGHVDVLSASEFDNKVAWYENDGSGGGWTLHTITTTAVSAQSVFAADVDGDGDLDALSASSGDDTIAWYENDGSGGGWTSHAISTTADSARSVFAADVDGDGDVDVLSASFTDDRIAWYRNDTIHRSAVFPGESLVSTTAYEALSVVAADVDGDGDLDVLAASRNDETIAWYENDGSGGTWTSHTVFTLPRINLVSVFAADVDGDGDLDVLSASIVDDTIAWYENDGAGGGWTQHTITTTNYRPESVIAADVDGDGDLDVLAISGFEQRAWYENDGAGGGWTHHEITTDELSGQSVSAADLDGDGDLDVLYTSSFHDTVDWYENDGSGGGWTPHTITTSAEQPNPRFGFAADVDGDGDVDALIASSSDEIAWYENDGSGGGWAPHSIATSADFRDFVFAADVDGDGDVDVLSASLDDNMIAWYENEGSGGDWILHTISTNADGATSVFAADLDGDGDLDVLSSSTRDDKIAWYENRGGQFALPTTDVAQKVVENTGVQDLLAIQVIHRGRPGDTDVELASLELKLTDGGGAPLTTGEAQNLIQQLRVYLDDGSGGFEENADTLVADLTNLSLTAGVQMIPLPDDDPAVRVAHGAPRTFFVVAEMTPAAESQTPSAFAVEHLTEGTSTGEDVEHDIPLILEHTPNVETGKVDTALTSASCQAPFDLVLANRTVDEALVCEAGTVIRAGTSFVVVSPGNLTFRAGRGVELATGFEVQGGAFTAEIEPGLEP